MKRVILSVTNDLSTDQRVDKVARSLMKMGFDVLLVGRKLPDSLPLDRPYNCKRMHLFFQKGPMFYSEYNLRLFLILMTKRAKVFLANDLDTLLANFLAAKLKGVELVYDSHEYFTEVPELENRRHVQRIWRRIERWIFPKLKHVYTVNESIASIYRQKYGVEVGVIRNLPDDRSVERIMERNELGLPEDRFTIVLQGAGINIDRGAEELLKAMALLPDCFLAIIGGGDVIPVLKSMVKDLGVQDRVLFRPRMPYEEMMQYTLNADLGVTLDKDTNLNYRYSLPNKVFDYIKAGIPVLSSDLPELRKVIDSYQIGCIVESHDPEAIAQSIKTIRDNPAKRRQWGENTKFAAAQLNWQQQEAALTEIFAQLG